MEETPGKVAILLATTMALIRLTPRRTLPPTSAIPATKTKVDKEAEMCTACDQAPRITMDETSSQVSES